MFRLAATVMIFFLPIAEIVTFILIGQRIGVWNVLGLLLLSAVIGIMLFRRTGRLAQKAMKRAMAGQEPDGNLVVSSAMSVVSAILFIIPGFITDVIALLLFLPPIRRMIWRSFGKSLSSRLWRAEFSRGGRRSQSDGFTRRNGTDGDIYDLSPEEFSQARDDASRRNGDGDHLRIGRNSKDDGHGL